jgi:LPS export ABC transporter protein LptC/lipopolysaccharide transport protein LptA
MRPFLIVFILLLVGFEILILFPKQTDKPTESNEVAADSKTAASATNQIQQKMQGVHLVESQRGTRDWELFSKSAQSYQNSPIWDLENVRIVFYNDEKQSLVLTGKKGKIDTKTKDMKIDGEVDIETNNGYIFSAPYVEYDSGQRLIFCSGLVSVKGPLVANKRSLFLKGMGMRIPVATQKMYLDQDVSGEKIVSDDKKINFKSHRAELSSLNQVAQFMESVVIRYPPMTMSSDNATFAYSEKSQLFEYLDLSGKVELRDENRRALSDKLRVDIATKQFTFSGQPRLYQGEDELSGEQIIFLDGGKKVKVEKVKLKSIDGI